MHSDLYAELTARNIINQSTRITGIAVVPGLGQVPQRTVKTGTVERIHKSYLICIDNFGKSFNIIREDINQIDGMTPERIAKVYNIKPNGTTARIGKKRGRKPNKS